VGACGQSRAPPLQAPPANQTMPKHIGAWMNNDFGGDPCTCNLFALHWAAIISLHVLAVAALTAIDTPESSRCRQATLSYRESLGASGGNCMIIDCGGLHLAGVTIATVYEYGWERGDSLWSMSPTARQIHITAILSFARDMQKQPSINSHCHEPGPCSKWRRLGASGKRAFASVQYQRPVLSHAHHDSKHQHNCATLAAESV